MYIWSRLSLFDLMLSSCFLKSKCAHSHNTIFEAEYSWHSERCQITEVKCVADVVCNTFESHQGMFHAVTKTATHAANHLWVHLLSSMAVSLSRAGSGSGVLVFTLLLSLTLSLSRSFSLFRLWCALSRCRLCCLFFWASNAFSLRACLWPL